MKLFVRPKCFSEAVAPVTVLNYILGLRAFEYPRGHPRPLLSLIYLLFIYVIYYNGSLTVHERFYASIELMKLEYVLYKLLEYIIIVSVIFKMLLGWWYTKKFKVCHKKIFEIDETLRQLGLTMNYDRIYFMTIGIMIAWIIFAFIACTVIFIHLYMEILSSIYLILLNTYSISVCVINIFEFCIFARYLQMKFELVNQFMYESLTNLSLMNEKWRILEIKDYVKIMDAEQRKHIPSTNIIFRWRQQLQSRINVSTSEKQDPVISQIESHFSQFEKQSVLRNFARRHNLVMTKCQQRKYLLQIIKHLHLELCKTSKLVCTIFGIQTAWEIGIIIIFLTASLYFLYVRYIMNQHKDKNLVGQTFITVIICFLHIVKVVFLSRICKNAADEGNRTIEIIHTIYDCGVDADMQQEIQQFSIQILQNPVTFFAYGLTLDNHILSMILKTVTTYMVIIIQVSNTLESNNAIQFTAHL